MRLFVAIWPPPPVVAALSHLEHPDVDTLRWTVPDRWHVTLVFLGDAAADGSEGGRPPDGNGVTVEEAVARLERVAVDAPAGTVARLGTVTGSFGRSVLTVPVFGLDELARAVRTTYSSGPSGAAGSETVPFNGHLTVARWRWPRDDVRPWAGMAVGPAGGMEWAVDQVALVASGSGGGKGHYETVATVSVPGDYPTSNMRSGLQ